MRALSKIINQNRTATNGKPKKDGNLRSWNKVLHTITVLFLNQPLIIQILNEKDSQWAYCTKNKDIHKITSSSSVSFLPKQLTTISNWFLSLRNVRFGADLNQREDVHMCVCICLCMYAPCIVCCEFVFVNQMNLIFEILNLIFNVACTLINRIPSQNVLIVS